ncbi:hypothetical protein [Bifidobacterium sp. SO1]|uniref:hypothetical protein n=1 Tax=Bifidobacterium sp. SO1 TaxID=2809029 RepID=UPI001BDBB36E|nr:hypothetical protein [Bifidobacterium sp. SO1]MBT1162169.1 hypothetical protein [Bifidobacterium sp. SO1]
MTRRYLTLRDEPHTVLVFDDKKTRDRYWASHDKTAWWVAPIVARETMIRATGLPLHAPIGEVVERYLTLHPDHDRREHKPEDNERMPA